LIQPRDIGTQGPIQKFFLTKKLDLTGARATPAPRVSLGVRSNPIVIEEEPPAKEGLEVLQKSTPGLQKDEKASTANKKQASAFNAKVGSFTSKCQQNATKKVFFLAQRGFGWGCREVSSHSSQFQRKEDHIRGHVFCPAESL